MLARIPSLDILVHCAGIMQTGSVEGMNLIDFDRAFEIMPEDVEGLIGRANVLQELLRYEEALANYERAIELQPDLLVAHEGRPMLKK